MTLSSLLLRLLLIVALALNGYAAAAMSVSGAHAMHAGRGPVERVAAPTPAAAAESTAAAAPAGCHGHEDGSASARTAAELPAAPAPQRAPPDDDCCGQNLCQCDCLQAAAIARIALPLPAPPAAAGPALPLETGAPSAALNRPIRPPIA